MRIIFLIPPSEWKNKLWWDEQERLSYRFKKPTDIIKAVSPSDLSCKWTRYEEACLLNHQTLSGDGHYARAIERYSGVMYAAIDYQHMSKPGKVFFESNFCIVSGMYGLVKPNDIIGNYKLPITSKWLYKYWWDHLTQALRDEQPDKIINLLPKAYAKALDLDMLDCEVIDVDFMRYQDKQLIKMAHGVKKTKWAWIKNICEQQVTQPELLWGTLSRSHNTTTLTIIEP